MNLLSIMGSEPLCMTYPFHTISILHSLSVNQDALLSTFKCTHFGFAPGYFIGKTLRRRSAEEVPC